MNRDLVAVKHKFKAEEGVDVGFGIEPSATRRTKKAKYVYAKDVSKK